MQTIALKKPKQQRKQSIKRKRIKKSLINLSKGMESFQEEEAALIQIIQNKPYQNATEKSTFLQELIKLVATPSIPIQHLYVDDLLQLHRIVRDSDRPKEITSDAIHTLVFLLSETIDLELANSDTVRLAYQLLGKFSVNAVSLLLNHIQATIFGYFFMPTRIYNLPTSEQRAIIQLVEKKIAHKDTRYTGVGIALLQDVAKKEQFALLLETFLQEIVPQIVQKIEQAKKPSLNNLLSWFGIWVHHQHPSVYTNPRGKDFSTLTHLSFEQILQYIPKVLLTTMDRAEKELLIHVAAGKNIRALSPYHLFTNRMIHEFVNLDKDQYTYGFRAAFLLSLDTPAPLIAVIASKIKWHPRITEKSIVELKEWKPLVLKLNKWFPTVEAIESEDLKDILSYVQHCKDEKIELVLKGRTLASLKRLVAAWDIQNSLKNIEDQSPWEGATYKEWRQQKGSDTFVIVQLVTPLQLAEEGAQMRHCVASYHEECRAGEMSIWSLRLEKEADEFQSLVTIEVDNQHQIEQMKSKYNDVPKPEHLRMIQVWANENNIQFV